MVTTVPVPCAHFLDEPGLRCRGVRGQRRWTATSSPSPPLGSWSSTRPPGPWRPPSTISRIQTASESCRPCGLRPPHAGPSAWVRLWRRWRMRWSRAAIIIVLALLFFGPSTQPVSRASRRSVCFFGLAMFWGLGLVFGSVFLATRSWAADARCERSPPGVGRYGLSNLHPAVVRPLAELRVSAHVCARRPAAPGSRHANHRAAGRRPCRRWGQRDSCGAWRPSSCSAEPIAQPRAAVSSGSIPSDWRLAAVGGLEIPGEIGSGACALITSHVGRFGHVLTMPEVPRATCRIVNYGSWGCILPPVSSPTRADEGQRGRSLLRSCRSGGLATVEVRRAIPNPQQAFHHGLLHGGN